MALCLPGGHSGLSPCLAGVEFLASSLSVLFLSCLILKGWDEQKQCFQLKESPFMDPRMLRLLLHLNTGGNKFGRRYYLKEKSFILF